MNTNDGRNHLYDLVNDFDVAMLVTHTANAIHARPMAIARMDDGIGAYLVTDINSLKIDEITVNPHAVLTFQSSRKFASVRGELKVLRDRQLIEKMWKESWKVLNRLMILNSFSNRQLILCVGQVVVSLFESSKESIPPTVRGLTLSMSAASERLTSRCKFAS